MLPAVQGLFTLVRQLANREPVTEIATSKWLVQRHGLAPLCARAGFATFREDLARATLIATRTRLAVRDLTARMADAGIRVAPIKGVSHAALLYDAPSERPMSDVDLLIEPACWSGAKWVMESAGYVRVDRTLLHHAVPWVRGDVVIDLHRSIIGPGRSQIDLDGVWNRARPAAWLVGGFELDAIDAHVFHLLNLVRSRLCAPLIQIVDVARLVERLPDRDPRKSLERAAAWGVPRAVAIAHEFCTSTLAGGEHHSLPWLVPDREHVAALAPLSWWRQAAFDVAVAGSPRQLAARALSFGANYFLRRTRALQARVRNGA